MNKRDAYNMGKRAGHGFARHNVPTIGETYRTDTLGEVVATPENIREIHEALCFEAESNSRDYSPFEFTAHAFNECEDRADGLWAAYDDGVAVAIRRGLRAYTDADYGINT